MAAGVGITFAVLQQSGNQQTRVICDNDNTWLNPSLLQNYQESLGIGAHYRSTLPVSEEEFFNAGAKGNKEPY